MSSSSKIITTIVVIVIIGLGLWLYSKSSAPMPVTSTQETTASSMAESQPDTSDASLDNDLKSVDSSFQGASVDASNVDKGLNDQPTQVQVQ